MVGYDESDDGGNGAWIVQNSWGASWGAGGFAKLAFDTSTTYGTCKLFYRMQQVIPGTAVTPL